MDTLTWSESYDYDAIDEFKKEHRKGSFVFVTEATVSKPRPDTLKVMYRMAVWLDGSVGEEVEPLLKKIGISAERIDGILGVNGTYRKWKCRKLSGLARVQKEGYIKLFELWTDESIRPRREDPRKDTFHLDIEVTFKPSRSHQEQIAHVLDLVFLKSTSHLGSAYDDSSSLVSRPPNLALQIGPKQYVWVTEEELAAASPYLTKLVNAISESGDAIFARRSLDNRIDFDAVDDDSDDEEDTRRYKLIREREEWEELERARSPAPGPVEKKRRLDDADETASQSSNLSSLPASEEEEDQGMAQAAFRPIWPAIMDTRAPRDGTRVIGVPDCALSTLQAVIIWIVTGRIVFAPLSSDGKEKRTAFIETTILEKSRRPVPVSPRSVYRLAERFRLDQLTSLALDDLKEKLTHKNAAALSLHLDCKNYPENKTLVHDYVRENWDYIRHYLDAIELKEDYQSILYANLMKPIGGKLRKGYN